MSKYNGKGLRDLNDLIRERGLQTSNSKETAIQRLEAADKEDQKKKTN